MSKTPFRVKNGLNIKPTDPADRVNPEAGDIIVDSTDNNKLKVYNADSASYSAIGTGVKGNLSQDFESATPDLSNVTVLSEITSVLPIDDNNESVKATWAGSAGHVQYEFPIDAALDGVQGLMTVWLKTSVAGLQISTTQDGVVQSSIDVNSEDKWKQYEIPFVMGGTEVGFRVEASGSVTGDVFIDEAFVGIAPAGYIQNIAYENYEEIDLTGSGDFTGGKIAVGRNGNIVSVTVIVNPTHASLSVASSAVGLLPDWARPALTAFNTYATTSIAYNMRVESDGRLSLLFYQNNAGYSFTNGGGTGSISYIAAEKKSDSTIVQQTNELTAKTANELSAKVLSNGTLVSQNYDWISSISGSTGDYTITFNTGVFTQTPSCQATSEWNGSVKYGTIIGDNTTSSQVRVWIDSGSGTATAEEFSISCSKQGVDVNKSQVITGSFEQIRSDETPVVRGAGNGGESITANVTDIPFTEVEDTHGAWDGDSFTAPSAGMYSIQGGVYTASQAPSVTLYAYINGSRDNVLGRNDNDTVFILGGSVKLNEGDVLTVRMSDPVTLSNFPDLHYIHIQKIPTTESIVANLNKNKNVECQTKYLSADVTSNGVISDLAFSNLTIGKRYRVQMRARCYKASTTMDNWGFKVEDGGAVIDRTICTSTTAGQAMGDEVTQDFTASGTSLVTTAESIADTNSQIMGTGTVPDDASYITLCELPDDHIETNKFD